MPVRTGGGVLVRIDGVLVRADDWFQTWTDYDVELLQRQMIKQKYGFDYKQYRWGLRR